MRMDRGSNTTTHRNQKRRALTGHCVASTGHQPFASGSRYRQFFGAYPVAPYTIELPWLVATLLISRLLALAILRWLTNTSLNDREIDSYSA